MAVTVDDSQEIIEVMGHAAGQPPQCFHLLRLPELFFQPLQGCDLTRDPDQANHGAIRITIGTFSSEKGARLGDIGFHFLKHVGFGHCHYLAIAFLKSVRRFGIE